jgi:hypothetical protein
MAAPVWRYDPRRGVYKDEEDPLAMPEALPPVFEQGPAGGAPVSPGVASSAAMAGVPTLEPVTVTAESNRTERAIPTADEAPLAKREEDALTERGKVGEKQADVAAKQKDTEAETLEKQAKNEEDRGKAKFEAQKQTVQYMGNLRQRADELEAEGANQEKGILGGWQKASTGERIVAGLAVMLSAIGQGLSGDRGPNHALGIVMDNWKRDREEAKAAIRRDYFDKAKSLRGPALDQAKEELEIQLHGVDAKYDGLAKQITSTGAALAARTGRNDVKLKTEEMMAVEQQKLAAEKLKREEALRAKKSQEFEKKQVIPSAGSNALPPDPTVTDLAGNPIGRARTLIEAEKVRDSQGKANQLLSALDDLKSHVLEHGRTDVGGVIPLDTAAVRAERENKIKGINGQLSALYAAGVLSEAEYKRSSGGLNTSLLKGGDAAAAGIDAIAKDVESAYNAHVRAKSVLTPGANPVNRGAPAGGTPPEKKPAANDTFTVPTGPHKGKRARRLPNGKAELLE